MRILLDVMTDLQNRGVRDILICCVDGLKGFPDAIQSVFPETSVQLCVVHQIRNSIKYVGSKHQKEFLKDLKTVYGAVSKDSALAQLDMVDEKWGEMYPKLSNHGATTGSVLRNISSILLQSASLSTQPIRLRAIIVRCVK